MTSADDHDERRSDGSDDDRGSGAIGVGMGGSCPVCRAPVDLGQEFCLECGSPIRFTPRQRRSQRTSEVRQTVPVAPVRPPKGGFPWIPFLVVLALIGGGGAFALLGNSKDGSGGSSGSDKTEPGLPTITNSQPETTSATQTTTLQDCVPTGSDDSVPATTDPATGLAGTDTGTGDQIPTLGGTDAAGQGSDGSAFGDTGDVPSTEPGGAGTVTVDQNGELCDTAGGATDPASTDPSSTDPASTDPAATDPTDSPGTDDTRTPATTPASTDPGTTDDAASASGDWPAGKKGWTVVVAGYKTKERATQRAADVQDDGFTDGGVLHSDDYASLCPGYYVVFSGVFDSESQAEQRMTTLGKRPSYAGMYVREVRTDGSKPNCTAVQ
ncbi:MAG: hypothetical protein JWM98_3078 [Thermoleophilia bacterium]|nr:hypothetical protein [Thermoleophilia bacterium]